MAWAAEGCAVSMDKVMDRVANKLSQAQSCLDKMRKEEQKAFGDTFDQYLSGFLSATISLRNAFHDKHNRKRDKLIKSWKKTWEGQLTPEQKCVYEFMRKDRNREVHGDGSKRIVRIKELKVRDYSDSSGTVSTMGSPVPLIGSDTRTTIRIPQYVFNIGGTERPVTEVCAEYLALLVQMVDQYQAYTSP
jgi:hypothetical protein